MKITLCNLATLILIRCIIIKLLIDVKWLPIQEDRRLADVRPMLYSLRTFFIAFYI